MGADLLNITAVATVPATSPTQYTVTLTSTTGVAANDHLFAELSDGTDAVYKILSVDSGVQLTVEDSLTEGNGSAEFGQPAEGSAAFGTPHLPLLLNLSSGPEGARGWRALAERNFAIVAEAVARKIRESGGTLLTMGAVSDGQFLKRSGTDVVGDAGTSPAHKDSHKSGGGDAFTSADLLEAVVKRVQESSGPTTLTYGSIADGETVKRVGGNLIGYTPAAGTVILDVAQGRLSVDSGDPTANGTSSTLYYLPHVGNQISLYDGSSSWAYHNFGTGLSFDLSSANDLDGNPIANNSGYDAVIWDDGGTKKIGLKKWTSTAVRATALALQDGVKVLTGDTGKRFVGSLCTDSSGNAVSVVGERRVSNFYNRIDYVDEQRNAGSSYTIGASVGPQLLDAGGSGPYSAYQHVFMSCREDSVRADCTLQTGSITGGVYDCWIGLDGVTQAGAKKQLASGGIPHFFGAAEGVLGLHTLAAVEETSAGASASVTIGAYTNFVAKGQW